MGNQSAKGQGHFAVATSCVVLCSIEQRHSFATASVFLNLSEGLGAASVFVTLGRCRGIYSLVVWDAQHKN